MRPRYRRYTSYEADKSLSGLQIFVFLVFVFVIISFIGYLLDPVKVKPREVPIIEISKPVTESIRPMNLSMGVATVKRIREAWYKVYFSVLNRDEKVFTGIIHASITENDRVTQKGIYPCLIKPGEERLVTYFTNVRPTYVRVKIEDMGLSFGARFTEVGGHD